MQRRKQSLRSSRRCVPSAQTNHRSPACCVHPWQCVIPFRFAFLTKSSPAKVFQSHQDGVRRMLYAATEVSAIIRRAPEVRGRRCTCREPTHPQFRGTSASEPLQLESSVLYVTRRQAGSHMLRRSDRRDHDLVNPFKPRPQLLCQRAGLEKSHKCIDRVHISMRVSKPLF